MSARTPEIINRRAKFEYFLTEKFEAGIQLMGTEVKSIRAGHVNMGDAFCTLEKGQLYVRKLHISEYEPGTINNHETMRVRKLLLRKSEINKIDKKVREKGMTIVPTRLYFNDRGFAKLEIALATGKKSHDKRQTIKDRDSKRELDRIKKNS